MKFEWRVMIGAGLFLSVIFVIYVLWSGEAAGSVMLLFGGAAYLMLGGFLVLQWLKRSRIPRPEDRDDGNYAEGAGEAIAFFPTASIWPAGIGLGATMVAMALIFGNWYFVIGVPLLLGSIIGFSVEAEAPE